MKKIILLMALTITVISCSKSDDSENLDQKDPIIGTWDMNVLSTHGNSIQKCWLEEILIVNADGTFTQEMFAGEELGNCTPEERNVISSTWENVNGKYHFQIIEETEEGFDTINIKPFRIEFTFPDGENNQDSMSLLFEEGEDEQRNANVRGYDRE